MKLKVYAIYDQKAEGYLQPFFLQSKGLAVRQFQNFIADSNTPIHKYPQDFTLFELGEYTDHDGKMHPHPSPISMGNALEFKREVENQHL